MIVTNALSKTYVSDNQMVDALQNFSVKVEKGEIVALLGPNGAGKSTTIKTLSTIIRPTSGTASVNGYDIQEDPLQVRASIGLASEVPGFYERLSGRTNIRFFGDLYDVPRSIQDERVENYVKKFGLENALDSPVGTYSKGMKQKLSILKALIHDPSLLMLDEPMDGLSPDAQSEMRTLFVDLVTNHNKTMLISTHNLPEAERIVDRILFINNGRLIEQGTPEQLRDKFLVHPLVRVKFTGDFDVQEAVSSLNFVSDVNLKPSGRIVEYEIDSFQNTPELISALTSAGMQIHAVSEIVPSLEEIYLSLLNNGGVER